MRTWRTGVLFAALTLSYTASIGIAHAGHNGAEVEITGPGECGETTFSASIIDPGGTHKVENMRLVVHADGQTQNQVIPTDGTETSITVGPFTTPSIETTTISWRVFGGGERDYDDPSWTGYGEAGFGADVAEYGNEHTFGWTVAGPDDPNPFTTWHTIDVQTCAGGGAECSGMNIDLGSIQFCLPEFAS
ncbi:hypothetical protein [Hoyosella subflava]|uniref:Secreted protein n=1 Tax=Hoyosella subflava (strain DSM 45089 / JCM 17490 / NBRC 109087 / DQS3-9A1) TaxID=443218 RepID=F6EQ69_HOYSD|nr:hypothetical protein [Hoyosella subflava]AEF39492.1 hypothetical protein AS9A_1040 [Hoyosella subflava DQS3-9A1]